MSKEQGETTGEQDRDLLGKIGDTARKHPVKTAGVVLGTAAVIGIGGWLLKRWLKGRKEKDGKVS